MKAQDDYPAAHNWHEWDAEAAMIEIDHLRNRVQELERTQEPRRCFWSPDRASQVEFRRE